MKTNRIIAILLALLMAAALFVGCQETEPNDTKAPDTQAPDTKVPDTQAPDTKAPDTQAPDTQTPDTQPSQNDELFWFTLNGEEIHLGVPYAELAEKLGDEAKPSETIESCDPGSDWITIQHYYPGITVNEDKNGNVFGIEMSEWAVGPGDVTVNGVLKLGEATEEDVYEVLGKPEEPNEYGIFYDWNGYHLGIYLNDDTGLLESAMVMQMG